MEKAVPARPHMTPMRVKSPGLSYLGKIGLAAVLASLMGVLGWYLISGPAEGVPLSCSLPAAPAISEEQAPASEYAPEGFQEKEGQLAGCSQEISDVSGPGDTIFALIYANLLDETASRQVASALAAVIQDNLNKKFDCYTTLKPPGRRYNIVLDAAGKFQTASIELDPANVFHAAVDGGRIKAWKEEVVLDYKVETATFTMSGNMVDTLLKASEGSELATKLTNVFGWDIDFRSESVKGDTCRVMFERRYADDKPSGYGRVLCAVYEGKRTGRKTAMLFNGQYYDEAGVELKKNFLRSPLKEIRITSRFGVRVHPVWGERRMHHGVDYGAPIGTPVLAISAGVVTFSGWQNGYGNYVCIKHDNGYESRYGHLHKIMVQKGQRVKQAQRIGLVGKTGVATGPHLDFQLLVGGKHRDPLSVKMVRSPKTVPNPLKPRFASLTQERFRGLAGLAITSTTSASDDRQASRRATTVPSSL